jgi:hypothetical protein
MPTTIHPLGLAYLAAVEAWEKARLKTDAAIRATYGKRATRWDVSYQDENGDISQARALESKACQATHEALSAMRKAGATVHPIDKE